MTLFESREMKRNEGREKLEIKCPHLMGTKDDS